MVFYLSEIEQYILPKAAVLKTGHRKIAPQIRRQVIIDLPEDIRQDMYDVTFSEFIKWNGMLWGDETDRSEIVQCLSADWHHTDHDRRDDRIRR